MVLFESGSPYERFLLSGQGAGHYDAAREWLDGTLQITWVTGAGVEASNGTQSLLQQGGVNLNESISSRHGNSRAKRLTSEDYEAP